MDSVFRSAREKLEKEHRESKETGKMRLEREKKDKEAAERQRRAVEASQRARRLETIESQMIMKVEDNVGKEDGRPRGGGDCTIQAVPPWMKTNMPQQRIARENDDYDVYVEWMKKNLPKKIAREKKDDDVFESDDEDGAEWEVLEDVRKKL